MELDPDFEAVARRLRNWGRWGPDDERGTLNLITDEFRVRAARLVRNGQVFDLGLPLNQQGPQRGGLRNNPLRLMSASDGSPNNPAWFKFADDFVMMPLQAGTQWDALGHVWYDGALYNGFPATSVTARGLEHDSIDKLSPGIVGRGVLLDVARGREVAHLAEGDIVLGHELEEVASKQGVHIGVGDIILVRTGWSTVFAAGNRDRYMDSEPGLSTDAIAWLRDRDVAAVACDNWGIGARPGRTDSEFFEVHMLALRDIGMPLGEHFVLEGLAAACAADGVYEFFFCSEIQKFSAGAGTPTNPLAIK